MTVERNNTFVVRMARSERSGWDGFIIQVKSDDDDERFPNQLLSRSFPLIVSS